MSHPRLELTAEERAHLNAGDLIGVNTVGVSLRDSNWNLRSIPPAPHVEVAPWPVAPRPETHEPPKITVAIPTLNRWQYLKDSLPKYIDNPHIHEIVICDENGFDALQIKQHYGHCEKLKVYINSNQLGAGANKVQAVSKASNTWVALLDSDNFADMDYFTGWHTYIATHGLDANVIYAPSKCHARPGHAEFDYTKYCQKTVSRANFKDCFRDGLWEMILNTGNFIVNKHKYVSSVPSDPVVVALLSRNSSLEALLKAGALIEHGMIYTIVPNMMWYHGLNRESVFTQNDYRQEEDRARIYHYFATLT